MTKPKRYKAFSKDANDWLIVTSIGWFEDGNLCEVSGRWIKTGEFTTLFANDIDDLQEVPHEAG